ncbi:MAG TPA: ABC transporter substrate-binding protein, partial [Candidatus Limnocylindria bacterium]|nr:ABC transporter substrate-binding protein [Candidatus Limnocylindria bacterium]
MTKHLHIMIERLGIILIAMLSTTATMKPLAASAAEKPLQKINVAYSSISGNMAPLWVTQEKGFFRKYGLEVQSILIESGTTTAQALVSGDISFASVAGPAIIQSSLRGADLVMISGLINTLTFQLYTDKSITRPDQFKGKSVGVTRYGAATDFAIRYALDKYGLDVNKDVAILQMGNVPAMLAAMEAGKIQGGMLSAPTSIRAKKMGFPMLADMQ